jgi:two-component system, sensor histidine kinase and response regulator
MAETKDKVASAIVRAQLELEEALSELDVMSAYDTRSVAFTAHALNNYLTVTGGTVELILNRLADHPDAQVKVWLEGLQHVTDLMTRAVGQLMNSSTTTEPTFRFDKTDLPLLVQRICNYYQRVAEKKAIRVVSVVSNDVPPVRTDRVAVAAVLDNLLSNAVKYSQPGKLIEVEVRGERNTAVCNVRDQGPGLSPEDQKKLFNKGVRLTPKPTGGESSMGYGLAVAKELIEKMSGEIWCESVLGQGSCFTIRIPAYEELTGSQYS